MIDRGPDPLGVIAVTRTLPNVCVLKGNHEDLMLRALRGADQVEMSMCAMDWAMNGGSTTSDAWRRWTTRTPPWSSTGWSSSRAGPRCAWGSATTSSRTPASTPGASRFPQRGTRAPSSGSWPHRGLMTCCGFAMTSGPTPPVLVNERGEGPIVIAGHTPTPYLTGMLGEACGPTRNADGLAQMVKVGASGATGGVADRWDIDAGAAGGAGFGPRPSPGRRRLFLRAYPSWRVAGRSQEAQGHLAPDGAGGPSRSPWGRAGPVAPTCRPCG